MVARYNPCGRVVDIGQDAYTTHARLYPDSDRLFKIRWYEATPDAKTLPFASALNNLILAGEDTSWYPVAVGEVFGSKYTQQPPNQNPLALGDHYCGTREDFGGHGQIDEDSPPVKYRPDGLPECCGDLFEARGGLGLGGTTTVADVVPILVQIVSSTGTPPVHTAIRMTRDTGNNVVEYTPFTEYTQVLNPNSVPLPAGALLEAYEIEDWPGWYWVEPVIQYADSHTVQLTLDTDDDTVTAVAITQLSIDQDENGIKLVNDSAPPPGSYYGTNGGGVTLGYQPFASEVLPVITSPPAINAIISALIPVDGLYGLMIIDLGGGIEAIGLDLTVASQTFETLDNSAVIGVTDSAAVTVTQTKTTYTNSFNGSGLILDRTAADPVVTDLSAFFNGSDSISVTGDALTSTITVAAIVYDSITFDADGIRLVGDSPDPGSAYLYGTADDGTKGWYALDGIWLTWAAGVYTHIGPQTSGGSSIAWPTAISYDALGHVRSATAGTAPVTSISTIDQTGGPLTGAVDFQGGTGIQLTTSGSIVIISVAGGGLGPAPTTAPTLTATGGNTTVSLSWTAATGATSYILNRGSTQIFSGSATSFVDTGLTNGTTYSYTVWGVNNGILGPPGTASATPAAPPVVTTATSSGTTGSMVVALPSNTAGQLLVVGLSNNNGSNTSPTAPSGWTRESNSGTGFWNLSVYYMVSTGGLGTVTFGSASQGNWVATALNVGALAMAAHAENNGASTPALTTSITVTGASGVLMNFYNVQNISSVVTPQQATVVMNAWLGCDYRTASAGATGSSSATLSISANWGSSAVFAH